MPDKVYDIVIVGGGPAGLSAAIYTSRRALKTLIISKDLGGQAAMTDEIENYPGFDSIGGIDLSEKFKNQAIKFGAHWQSGEVIELKRKGEDFIVTTSDKQEIEARAIILAFGLTPRNLEVPGEKEFTGRGVSYCATCDGPLYKGKNVAVIGGGNSALDAAEFLSKISAKVYLIHRREEFRGEQVLLDQVKAAPNVEMILNANTKEIRGDTKVTGLIYEKLDGQKGEIKVDGVFVEIGHIAKTDWLEGLVDLSDVREIKIDKDCATSAAGIFAAGDVSDITYKQVVISAGEGAKAALQAYRYLQGNKPLLPDWSTSKKKFKT